MIENQNSHSSSDSGSVGLWGPEDGLDESNSESAGDQRPAAEDMAIDGATGDGNTNDDSIGDGRRIVDDPTSDLLNLPPGDDLSTNEVFLPLPLPTKRQPPTFQGAFSQARLQQQNSSSAPAYRQAFNWRSPSLFNPGVAVSRSQATHNQPNRSNNRQSMVALGGSINSTNQIPHSSQNAHNHQLSLEIDKGTGSVPPGNRSDSDEFDDAVSHFLDSIINSQSDNLPQTGANDQPDPQFFQPSQYRPRRGSGGLDPSPQDEDHDLERTLHRIAHSLGKPASPSASATTPNIPRPKKPLKSPSRSPTPKKAPAVPASSSSSNQVSAKPSNPLPSLCLPPRPPKLPYDKRYSSTPYNSPAGSVPQTPTLSFSAIPSDSASLRKLLKPSSESNVQPPFKRKKIAPKKQSNPLVPSKSEGGSIAILKEIAQLRSRRGLSSDLSTRKSKEEVERLEKKWDDLVQHSSTLEGAIELQKCAEKHVEQLKRMKDSLSEELVRVQIEESVLRHVRGIIADRQSNRQEWT